MEKAGVHAARSAMDPEELEEANRADFAGLTDEERESEQQE